MNVATAYILGPKPKNTQEVARITVFRSMLWRKEALLYVFCKLLQAFRQH